MRIVERPRKLINLKISVFSPLRTSGTVLFFYLISVGTIMSRCYHMLASDIIQSDS
jgi:hypothetical protein